MFNTNIYIQIMFVLKTIQQFDDSTISCSNKLIGSGVIIFEHLQQKLPEPASYMTLPSLVRSKRSVS